MNSPSVFSKLSLWVVLALPGFSAPAVHADSYSPEHPKVREMVERAVAYLCADNRSRSQASGSEVLIGYAVLLGQENPEHPVVLRSIEFAQELIRRAIGGDTSTQVVYSAAISVVLLAYHDPIKHRALLESARDWLVSIQRPHGGFGYLAGANRQDGDTSQIQYVVLAFYALNKAGVKVPVEAVEAVLNFLQRVQDPSGAWGYQGVLPAGNNLVHQHEVSKSLGTAGICAFLMASDILKLFGGSVQDADGIPSAFKRLDNIPKVEGRDSDATITLKDVERTIEAAFRFQDNSGPQGRSWYYYWRYGQERYESFRELVQGKRPATWYDQAVDEFAQSQNQDGSWRDGLDAGPLVDTAFVILFLVRSTQRTIAKSSEGLAFGGYELPKDTTNVRMVGGRIVSDAEMSVESLLGLMEDESNRVSEGMLPRAMQLSSDPKVRAAQSARLSRLLRSPSHTSRQLAARLLGRSEDISVAPDLIYALMDPDPYVPQIAEEGLRLLSRKLNAVHLRVNPNPQERRSAVQFWKNWYLGLKPEHLFPASE